jgi:hypothetical protein
MSTKYVQLGRQRERERHGERWRQTDGRDVCTDPEALTAMTTKSSIILDMTPRSGLKYEVEFQRNTWLYVPSEN